MHIQQQSVGSLCIVFGALLFFSVAGEWLFRLALALCGLFLINYGFRLRGMLPPHVLVLRWFHRGGYY